jgi:hemolysin activation/secretion protein
MWAGAQLTLAQVQPPDAGSLLRKTDPNQSTVPPSPDSLNKQSRQRTEQPEAGARAHISAVHVVGATRYSESELQQLLSDIVGHEVSYLDMRRAADRITQHYRADGWFARAYMPEQSLQDGILTINVIEAKLGDVHVEAPPDGAHVGDKIVHDMLLERQSDPNAVAIDALERATLLIEDLPGISAKVLLAPGDEAGETDILARVSNTRFLRTHVEADNSGVQSTGRGRLTGQMLLESPLGRGDELGALLNYSDGTKFGRLSYEIPVGADGWRIRPAASVFEYELKDNFAALDAHGHAATWEIMAIYPWVRSNQLNVQIATGYEHRHYENFALDLQTSSPLVRAFQGVLSVDRVDSFGGGGIMQYGLQFTRGTLELLRNSTDLALDSQTARSDGPYLKLGWNIARLQRLGGRDQLLLKLVGQSASTNLSSSEKLSLGGASGVRAYPELEASGDQGWIAITEWFHSLARDWRFSLFYDYGEISQHESTWTDWNLARPSLRNHYALQGAGTSIGWSTPGGFSLRGSVATRTAKNPARDPLSGADGDGTSREPQLWFVSRWEF